MTPPSKDSYRKFGIEILESLHRDVKAAAAKRGISLKVVTEEALKTWLLAASEAHSLRDFAEENQVRSQTQKRTKAG